MGEGVTKIVDENYDYYIIYISASELPKALRSGIFISSIYVYREMIRAILLFLNIDLNNITDGIWFHYNKFEDLFIGKKPPKCGKQYIY